MIEDQTAAELAERAEREGAFTVRDPRRGTQYSVTYCGHVNLDDEPMSDSEVQA